LGIRVVDIPAIVDMLANVLAADGFEVSAWDPTHMWVAKACCEGNMREHF
jgi:hypothetical protein